MADGVVPHFQNDGGLDKIEIGAKEFQCIGAKPPFDHPHVYLDMGDETEIVCPYCSTLYRYNPDLAPGEADPAHCVWTPESSAA
ncbi:zinc-finger domain-containing protein [Stappia sp.]|uniref:zinc-finger domain-containing protein n=1 Tax=Stappia sp. TaxID=1870903 RepID=UPI0032D8D824